MGTTFSEIIKSDTPTLVDFFAEWCNPCKVMKPILEDVKARIGDKVTVLKIDIDKNPQVAQIYHIQSVPTLIIFKNGQAIWRQSGVIAANDLESIVRQHIN